MLRLVWLQLETFRYHPSEGYLNRRARAYRRPMDDTERDRRSRSQWLRSILDYLEFGAGDSWRRLSDPAQRNSSDRTWYLNGIRQVKFLPGRQALPPPPLRIVHLDTPDPRAAMLAAESRAWLVDQLLLANPANSPIASYCFASVARSSPAC